MMGWVCGVGWGVGVQCTLLGLFFYLYDLDLFRVIIMFIKMFYS